MFMLYEIVLTESMRAPRFPLSPTKAKHTVCVIVVYYHRHIVFLSEIRGMPNSEDSRFYKKGTIPLEGKK